MKPTPASDASVNVCESRFIGRSMVAYGHPRFPLSKFIGHHGAYLHLRSFVGMHMSGDSVFTWGVCPQRICDTAVSPSREMVALWWSWCVDLSMNYDRC